MTLNQKVISGGILSALLIAALFIGTLGDRMVDYTVLFAQLDAGNASEIITQLEQQKIPYRIIQNGTAIEVPVDQADRLKIEFSATGLPESGIVGYEILDTTNFGMSDALQKINYKRALEGELSRTLRTLDEVEFARVLLVIPEQRVFTEAQEKPTATVLLRLKSGRSLPPRSVEAISNLVASAAVEGLNPQDVAVFDTGGNQLSKPVKDEIAMQSSTMMELKFTLENMLADKVKRMLDGAFGMGIALVTVNADIDFESIERQTRAYDQENSAIVSQVRDEVTNPDAEGGGQETINTNYDTGSIVENLIKRPGSDLKRLTASVIINEKTTETENEAGEIQVETVPWSQGELTSIQSVSEAALGFNAERGDRIEIVSMSFSEREVVGVGEGLAVRATIVESVKVVTTGIAIIVALAFLFVTIRHLVNFLDPSKIKIAAEKEFQKIIPDLPEEEEGAPSERSELLKKIVAKSVQEPEMSAKTIKSLYRET